MLLFFLGKMIKKMFKNFEVLQNTSHMRKNLQQKHRNGNEKILLFKHGGDSLPITTMQIMMLFLNNVSCLYINKVTLRTACFAIWNDQLLIKNIEK